MPGHHVFRPGNPISVLNFIPPPCGIKFFFELLDTWWGTQGAILHSSKVCRCSKIDTLNPRPARLREHHPADLGMLQNGHRYFFPAISQSYGEHRVARVSIASITVLSVAVHHGVERARVQKVAEIYQ